MEITQEQYERISSCYPVQRGNVRVSNLQVLNAILYVPEHGCKWQGSPPRFGRWHTVYTRMNRWSKNGVLDRVFEQLQREQIVRIRVETVGTDSTMVKGHPDGYRSPEKKGDPIDREVPERVDHQDSYGCRGCSNGGDVLTVTRPGTRSKGCSAASRHRPDLLRFDKLDVLFLRFITFALIHDTPRSVNAP